MMQNLSAFQWEGKNLLWDTLLDNLDAAIDVETVTAISADTTGEARIHQSGRADALLDFKNHLVELRESAVSKLN
jgi:hypothetical protein